MRKPSPISWNVSPVIRSLINWSTKGKNQEAPHHHHNHQHCEKKTVFNKIKNKWKWSFSKNKTKNKWKQTNSVASIRSVWVGFRWLTSFCFCFFLFTVEQNCFVQKLACLLWWWISAEWWDSVLEGGSCQLSCWVEEKSGISPWPRWKKKLVFDWAVFGFLVKVV